MPRTLIALCALLGSGLASAGDIYCNAQRTTCTDIQTPGSQLVTVRTTRSGSESTSADKPAPASGGTQAASSTSVSDATRQAVQKDVAAVRAEQCKKAQDQYDRSVQARRIYKEGKDGEREYLTDEQADAARQQARLERDAACGTQSSAE